MRQTPFGVWNERLEYVETRARTRCNEADAFRRLELDDFAGIPAGAVRCNEADAFRRLELVQPPVAAVAASPAAMRQTPFGVWNLGVSFDDLREIARLQ